MSCEATHVESTETFQRLCCFTKSTLKRIIEHLSRIMCLSPLDYCCVDHIINDDSVLALNRSDEVH